MNDTLWANEIAEKIKSKMEKWLQEAVESCLTPQKTDVLTTGQTRISAGGQTDSGAE